MKKKRPIELDYIDKMVEETFKLQSKVVINQLEFCFENSENLYFANYNSDKRSYELFLNNFNLEFPENWGPFKELNSGQFKLQIGNDLHDLIPIFEKILSYEIQEIECKLLEKQLCIKFFPRISLQLAA